MKKIILIGSTKTGKTTLLKILNGEEYSEVDMRTQSLEFEDQIIDTPGEYIENRVFYTALISAAQEAELIALVADAEKKQSFLPPGFATIFVRPVIGIVTKIDSEDADIEFAEESLKMAGAEKIFKTSAKKDIGIKKLKKFIDNY